MWICGFLTIIALYIKNSKLPDTKRSGFVDFYDLWSADALVAQNDVDLWILKIRNQDPKSQSNHTQNAVDLWIFIMDLSIACLRLETLIVRIDVDLWIFENQYNVTQKPKGSGRKTPWICGVMYCNSIISAKGCGFVDFWKRRNQDPKSHRNHIQKIVDLWIFIMELS